MRTPEAATSRSITYEWLAPILLGSLFFVSGLTGLAYEVIWFKRFASVWGSSSFAMATVVASFLAGLGLGAWLAGRVVSRARNCLAVYGLLEVGIALFAMLIPYELHFLQERLVGSLADLQGSAAFWFLIRFSITFMVLGPPCMMMGATLPVLVVAWPPVNGGHRQATPTLYAVNTLGAAIGCLLTGFFLLPILGIELTNATLIIVNGTIGLAAMVLAKLIPHSITPHSTLDSGQNVVVAETQIAAPPLVSEASLYLVSMMTGFAALILQMTWSRQLSVVFGSSTYGFSATVFVMLFGIGAGSWTYHALARARRPGVISLVAVIIALDISICVGTHAIPSLCELVGATMPLRRWQLHNAVICMAIAATLELLPALAMGILFPWLIDFSSGTSERIGRCVGNIYAANILGSVFGALITAELLFPAIGTLRTVILAMAIYCAVAMILMPMETWRQRCAVAVVGLFALSIPFVARTSEDPRLTNYGDFLYGIIDRRTKLSTEVLHFKEGPSSNVLVTRSKKADSHALRVNGKVDASSNSDMSMQLGLAYFPMMLKPDARDVFVVGFGSGTTAGAVLQFPETQVTCCEIEPSIIEAAEHFTMINHDPVRSPRFSVVLDDARGFLHRTNQRFDLILSEPSNPWIAGVSSLFTTQFYEAVKKRLNQHGIFAQWIQTYSLSMQEYNLILRTTTQAFPYCLLVRISGGDTILLLSENPIPLDQKAIAAAQRLVDSLPSVKGDLTKHFSVTDLKALLLQRCSHDESGIRTLLSKSSDTTVNTDFNMRLEFDAPLRLFQQGRAGPDIDAELRSTVVPEWYQHIFGELGCDSDQLPMLRSMLTEILSTHENTDAQVRIGLALAEIGGRVDPDDPFFAFAKLALTPAAPVGDEVDRILANGKSCSNELSQLGYWLWTSNRFNDAVLVYEKLVAQNPGSTSALANLAVNLASADRMDEAKARLAQLKTLDPVNLESAKIERAIEQATTATEANAMTNDTSLDAK